MHAWHGNHVMLQNSHASKEGLCRTVSYVCYMMLQEPVCNRLTQHLPLLVEGHMLAACAWPHRCMKYRLTSHSVRRGAVHLGQGVLDPERVQLALVGEAVGETSLRQRAAACAAAPHSALGDLDHALHVQLALVRRMSARADLVRKPDPRNMWSHVESIGTQSYELQRHLRKQSIILEFSHTLSSSSLRAASNLGAFLRMQGAVGVTQKEPGGVPAPAGDDV